MIVIDRLLAFFLQGIPESSGLIAVALALAGVRLRWGRILAMGIIPAVVVFLIRASSFPAGLHTVASLLAAVIIITAVTRIPPTKAFVVVLAGVIILGFIELFFHEIFFSLLKLELQQVAENGLLWTLLGLPQVAALFIIALIVARFIKPGQEEWKI